MTFESLDQWRRTMGFTIARACSEIGITPATWEGFRKKRVVPAYISLACKNIYHRMGPWTGPTVVKPKPKTKRRVAEASMANLSKGRRRK